MKKIIGVAVAASLVAGMAFADVAVSLNARMRADMYNQTKNVDKDKVTTKFDLDGYKDASDTLAFAANNDYAGVALDLTINGSKVKDELDVTTKFNTGAAFVPNTDVETKGTVKVGKTKDVSIDTYYGYLKFNALKFTAGILDSRYTNRLNVSAVEHGLTDGATAKYGISSGLVAGGKAVGETFGFDFGNMAKIAGGGNLSFIADYTIADLPGTLLLKAALLENKYKDKTTDKQEAGYAFEVGYMQKDMVNLDVILKMPTEDQFGFGAYVTPLMLPLKTVVGFTYIKDDTAGSAKKGSAWALDGRAVYPVSDALNTVLQVKYTSVSPDGGDTESALEVVGSVSYIVNDLVTVQCDAGYYGYDLDDNDKSNVGENLFKIRPAAKFTAGKNAAITAGLEYTKALNTGDATAATDTLDSKLAIPVILRVKM
ncbi:hypothetical protein HRI96_01420 [Treponema parvum]|uniref:Major outer membrane protein n=1 Tax=Treponema parvum TaxID=138851 RepID=A0A975EXX3_9SPIR|nr:hypothetical protein [Treponema parvum]QTQ10971.1 hypothetical protein HRI96_01420 [Treponema parvum]QTQ17082.1 hypothetical protein HXT04_10490 [Treponema parvum]